MKLNKPAIYLLLTLSILIMVSCNQAEKAGTALIPDNDYNVLLTVDFQEFFSSDIWEEVEDEIGELGVKQLFGELEKMLSVKLDDLETMVMAIELKPEVLAQGKQPESGLVYVEGDVDEGDVEDLLKEDPAKTDLDDDDIEGFDMLTWENNDAEKAVVFLKDGYLRGLQDDVEDAVDVMVKGGKSLVTSKNYAEYAELFSNSSTITLNVWQLDDILEDLLEIGQKGKLEEDDEDFMTSLEELTAASLAIGFDEVISVSLKLHFDDEDVTETVVEFLEDFPKRLIENKMNSGEAANQFEQIIVEIYKDLEYSNEDNVVEISLEISSDSDLFKSFFHGFKEASQKPKVANSVVAVKNIGQSIEQYVMDNYRVGSPKVANIDDLMTILEATEILSVRDFMKDDWGNSLVYIPDSSVGSRSYKLISYGSDGKPGPQPQNGGVYNSKIDIIWENGRFIQLPN